MAYSELYPWLRIERKFGPWLNSEELEMVKVVRDYMQEKAKPRVWEFEGAHHGRDAESAWDAIAEVNQPLIEMGLQKAGIPEQYGGLGLSLPCRMAIAEEMCRVDLAFTMESGKTGWFSGPIFASKNELLKKMMAEKLCSNDFYTCAVCFTEPQGGVNIEDITLRLSTSRVIAQLDGNEYVLNGQKIFPGPSGPPELFQRKLLKGHLGYLVVATTEPVAEKRNWDTIGIFYVPPDAQGLSFSTPYEKMGCTVEYNRDIHFDEVRIAKEYRLAGPGFDAALYYAMILAGCKLGEACRLVGLSAGLFDKVLDNTLHREIGGKPLREHSLWAAIIGEMAEKIYAGRAMYMYAAHAATHPDIYGKLWDQDGAHGICAAAKDVCGQFFRWTMDKAMDLHGGYGYCCEFGLEKIKRDGEIIVLGPGGGQRDKLDTALMFYPRKWTGKAEPFVGWTP